MSENAEYDQLVGEKSKREREYAACEERIGDCDDKLRRLRTARDAVSDLKKLFKDEVRYKDKGVKNDDAQWSGTQYDVYKTKMDSLVDINEKYFDDTLDFVLDRLNTEITNVKNERNDEYGLLGWLGDRINNLTNAIVNFFN